MGAVQSRWAHRSAASQPNANNKPGLCGRHGRDFCCLSRPTNPPKTRKQESVEAYEPMPDLTQPRVAQPPTAPSLAAATVAAQWKHGSVKKAPLTEKASVVSFSDDSLLNEDSHHQYNLSEQSHEALQQIIRCFPFPPSSPDSASSGPTSCQKPPVVRTLSNDPNPHDRPRIAPLTAKSLEAPASIRTSGGVEEGSAQPRPKARRRQLGALWSRRPTLEQARLSHDNNEDKKSALGRLCKVSVDTMAITALPLDCWLKERLKNWVQLSGHEGTIVPASNHTLWKKQPAGNNCEAEAYHCISADAALKGLTPKFYKEMVHNNDSFIEIQDLLSQFPNVSERAIMDIKMGTRTFLESEVANATKRKDLYKKMVDMDPDAPTEEERQIEAITKLRYMQFRERESSTASLGFRIEAAQLPGGKLQKSFKKVRTKVQVLETFNHFLGPRRDEIKRQLSANLKTMRAGVEQSEFFRTHEVVGSSILIIYDDLKAGAWIIDFAKSIPVPAHLELDHRTPWQLDNHEDGYLTGLDNLIEILDWEWS